MSSSDYGYPRASSLPDVPGRIGDSEGQAENWYTDLNKGTTELFTAVLW